jgi:hypothetical protein
MSNQRIGPTRVESQRTAAAAQAYAEAMPIRRGVWTHRPILVNQEGFDLVCTSKEPVADDVDDDAVPNLVPDGDGEGVPAPAGGIGGGLVGHPVLGEPLAHAAYERRLRITGRRAFASPPRFARG